MWILLQEENAFTHKDLVTLPDLPFTVSQSLDILFYILVPREVVNTNQFQRG